MDFRSEMAATSQLLLKGEGIEAIERLQDLFESAVAARDARWVVLIGRHLSILSEHQQLNDRAAETLRAAIAVVPGDPTLHFALADFEERDAAVGRLELALRLVEEGPEDWKVPYMREMIERQLQLRK